MATNDDKTLSHQYISKSMQQNIQKEYQEFDLEVNQTKIHVDLVDKNHEDNQKKA